MAQDEKRKKFEYLEKLYESVNRTNSFLEKEISELKTV